MQSNKTNANNQKLSRAILLNAIDYLRHKVANDELSVGEYQSLMRIFGERLDLFGTADDFADFFGKSKNNVRVVLCRKTDATPVRKVLYPFSKLVKAVPRTWIDGVTSQT